ncbi:MAG TPA: HPr family phosphocarrier protein [Firmicutes bacterium]|jgi:phosphocarrier protein|nr:HPr family phosphocarrier protein [Bacillota bacterium]HBT16445.1 HPr family phosphocarrier protein [Bacillota bacterium]
MRELKVKIKTETGLHARPASLLVNTVSKFKSKITIEKDGQEANLQSILGLLSLGVSQNDEIIIKASGKDEDEAIEAVINCGKNYDLW